jgi:thiamine-phosphate pyrophosphorylase
MVIVISNPVSVKDEHQIINQLFDEGLEIFHLRKPECSKSEIADLLEKIDSRHYTKIALHQHHEIAETFGMQRLHFTEESRKQMTDMKVPEKKILSSSIHAPEDSKTVSPFFEYVFLGPVFDSISKPGHRSILNQGFKLPEIKKTKLIALGGVDNSKIQEVKGYEFDGIAVLGHIWKETKNAVSNFRLIKTEWEK